MMLRIIVAIILTGGFASGKPSGLNQKIVGGTESDIYNVPYQASLQYNKAHYCGGSIIGVEHILTAAHCVHSLDIRKMSVSVGGSYHNLPLQNIPVYRYKQHDYYDSTTYNNDIAIIQLVSKMALGPNVLPIALPNQNEFLPEGSVGIVSGWGQISENLTMLPARLRTVKLPTISNELCQKLNYPYLITDNMICAAELNGGKDACKGDSGSGFISNGKLFGITSWGIGCGRQGKAGVYTKVSVYRNWIKFYTGI